MAYDFRKTAASGKHVEFWHGRVKAWAHDLSTSVDEKGKRFIPKGFVDSLTANSNKMIEVADRLEAEAKALKAAAAVLTVLQNLSKPDHVNQAA